MIYKHILLLLAVAALSACTTVSSFIDEATKTTNETPVEIENEQNPTVDGAATNSVAPLSESELLVQALVSQSDLYQSSKRVLAPDIKSKVVIALNEFNKNEFEKSEKTIKQILSKELNLTSSVYVLAGDIALANNKQADAIKYYINALELNDYNAKAANRLAMQRRELGDFAQAEQLYIQAINAQPSKAESYRNRAVLYDLYLNEKEKALQDYQAYSALLNYRLLAHENPTAASAGLTEGLASNTRRLSDSELKSLQTNIKLVKRWLADVGRQVKALASANANSNMSGN
jgi:tetratricopeptide (TPR) repeat protein